MADHRQVPCWDEMRPLFARLAVDGDPALRERLVVSYLPFAHALAQRYTARPAARDELEQVACVGLVLAVDRFDCDHGSPFPAFASVTILGELRRHFRDRTWGVRPPRRLQELSRELRTVTAELEQRLGREPTTVEIAVRLGVDATDVLEALEAGSALRSASLDAPLGGDGDGFSLATLVTDDGDGESRYHLVDELQSLRVHLRDLSDRERRLLKLRFFDGWTQARIADDLGVSQMHVSRLLTRTLDQLHERLVDRDDPTPG